jgi:DNA-binding NarL/FixJ family response regulator
MHVLRILVVEDYAPFRRLLCTALQQRAECQTIPAADGLEAVQKAGELQPDLILLDLHLPKLNGIEAAKRIRTVAPHARLLFVSQESSAEVIRETFRLGAQGYVQKLSAASDLLPAIDAVLRGQRFVSRALESTQNPDGHLRHEVQFYSDDSVLLSSFTRFIAASLTADSAAIVLATNSHRESLAQRLKGEGFDIDGAIQQGTYVALDAADILAAIMNNGVPDRILFLDGLRGLIHSAATAATTAHPRVAICGECVGLLCADGNLDAAISLEKTGNDLITTSNVDILCAYPLRHCQDDDHTFKLICAEHTAVYSR